MALKSDRPAPCSLEAEQGVLGCILLDPRECVDLCAEKLPRSADVFYDLRHQTLYDIIQGMRQRGELIDPIALQQHLKDRNQLEALGGMPYIAGLMNCVPSAANLEYYLEIVKEKFLLRSLINACTRSIARVYEQQGEVEAILGEAEREILAIGNSVQSEADKTVKALVLEAIGELEGAHQNQGTMRGLSTGFYKFDEATGGLRSGQMIVIAARPSVGKTSLAMNIAEHVAVDQRQPVGVFSLEMGGTELIHRMTCSRARVDSEKARDGRLSEGDFPRLTSAAGKIASCPLYICDRSGLSIAQLSARARRMHQQHKLKLLVIDYLQLMQGKGSRYEQITEISMGVKALAKDLGVPVIILSQLSRDVEKDDREPRLSDLRESGAIEQDADIVLFLHPTKKEDGTIPDPQPVKAKLDKHRGGRVGCFPLNFLRSLTRFETASPCEDVPTNPTPKQKQKTK